jgi:hypothetical protein
MPPRRKATAARREQWAQQRQDKLAQVHTQLVDQVATLTDADAWRSWLSFASRFHGYSFNNVVLIQVQRPDATWVAGIKRWNSMGRLVRQGEHGIAILAPVTARVDGKEPEPTDPGEPEPAGSHLGPAGPAGVVSMTGAGATALVEAASRLDNAATLPGRVLRGFKIATVFDIAQTEGDPIDPPARPGLSDVEVVLLSGQAPPGVWDALVGIAAGHGYRVERGFCDGANGYIRYADQLIKVRDDVDDAQAVKTLAHELGHMLLHDPGDFLGGMTGACRGEKEVEAESTAFLVAAHAGLDTSSYTFGYVTGWAEQAVATTGKTPHEIVAASGARVVRAAAELTTALDVALGYAEPPVPPALAQQVAAGVQAAALVRTDAQSAATSQPSLFDGPPAAGRAFPAPTPQTQPAAAWFAAAGPPAPLASTTTTRRTRR